jgi:hypothetical protein
MAALGRISFFGEQSAIQTTPSRRSGASDDWT